MCLLVWIYSFSSFVSSIKYEKKEKLQTQNTITLVLMFTCQSVMISVISLDGFELFSNFLFVHPWRYSWASSGRQLALQAMNSAFFVFLEMPEFFFMFWQVILKKWKNYWLCITCMWLCLCVCMYCPVHECVEGQGWFQVTLSIAPNLSFWDMVSHGLWGSLSPRISLSPPINAGVKSCGAVSSHCTGIDAPRFGHLLYTAAASQKPSHWPWPLFFFFFF